MEKVINVPDKNIYIDLIIRESELKVLLDKREVDFDINFKYEIQLEKQELQKRILEIAEKMELLEFKNNYSPWQIAVMYDEAKKHLELKEAKHK